MTCSTVTSVVVRPSIGMVSRQVCFQRPAPCKAEASYRSRGMSCRPARYKTKLKPIVHHTVTMTTEYSAMFGDDSQPGAPRQANYPAWTR